MNSARAYLRSAWIIGLLLVYVATLSAVVPWTGDDITYKFNFTDGRPISSVNDIYHSQIAHWHNNNGRFLAHFLVQGTLALTGRPLFVMLNVLAYVTLILLLLKLTDSKFEDWKSMLAACILALLALPTKFVPSCQIGYIWMFDIVLFFLLEWKRFVDHKTDASLWNLLWLIPLSFFAGFSQEAIVIGIGASLVIKAARGIRSLGTFGYGMMAAFGLGATLLCLSPGNFARTAEEHGVVGNLDALAGSLVKFCFYQRVSYILLMLIVYLNIKRHLRITDIYKSDSFLFNAWGALIIFNAAVGVFGNRQFFGAEIIAVILILRLIKDYLPGGIVIPQSIIGLALTILLSWNVYAAFRAKKIYQAVVTEYRKSSDGVVNCNLTYFDRHYRESGPADAWSWYVTETVNRLMHINSTDDSKQLRIVSTPEFP